MKFSIVLIKQKSEIIWLHWYPRERDPTFASSYCRRSIERVLLTSTALEFENDEKEDLRGLPSPTAMNMKPIKLIYRKARNIAVIDVMSASQLNAHQRTKIRTTFMHGLSGGKTHLVCTGYKLMASLLLISLQDPTSGLYSFTTFNIVWEWRSLAHLPPMTMIVTVYQPRDVVFCTFDTLLLTSKFLMPISTDNCLSAW